jgi:hypothetical protein
MKYLVAIETIQLVETDAETEDAAIELVKQKINYKPTDATKISIVKEAIYNEEKTIYEIKE